MTLIPIILQKFVCQFNIGKKHRTNVKVKKSQISICTIIRYENIDNIVWILIQYSQLYSI